MELLTITVFNGMRQEVIACFVDIGDHHCIQWYEKEVIACFVDIGDHHCIQWYETRGDCLFC